MTYLPLGVDTTGLGEIESWGGVIVIEADNQARDSKRSHSSTLCVFLQILWSWYFPSCPRESREQRERDELVESQQCAE